MYFFFFHYIRRRKKKQFTCDKYPWQLLSINRQHNDQKFVEIFTFKCELQNDINSRDNLQKIHTQYSHKKKNNFLKLTKSSLFSKKNYTKSSRLCTKNIVSLWPNSWFWPVNTPQRHREPENKWSTTSDDVISFRVPCSDESISSPSFWEKIAPKPHTRKFIYMVKREQCNKSCCG